MYVCWIIANDQCDRHQGIFFKAIFELLLWYSFAMARGELITEYDPQQLLIFYPGDVACSAELGFQ